MSLLTGLLATPEGAAALKVLAPLASSLADYIAGRRDEPPELADVPATLKSELALERARYRANHGGSDG